MAVRPGWAAARRNSLSRLACGEVWPTRVPRMGGNIQHVVIGPQAAIVLTIVVQ
jgi:hypothetical protein